MDSGGDQVNVVSDAGRNAVVIASEMIFARVGIGVDEILCLQERLCLFNGGVDLEPCQAFGRLNSLVGNAALNEPLLDSSDGLN